MYVIIKKTYVNEMWWLHESSGSSANLSSELAVVSAYNHSLPIAWEGRQLRELLLDGRFGLVSLARHWISNLFQLYPYKVEILQPT